MNRVVDLLLRKVFVDFKLAPSQNKGEINVINLRMNPEAEVFNFLRGLPVQIVEGTAASVTVSGVSIFSILRDVWRAYRNNQLDLKLGVRVSDVSVTVKPKTGATTVPSEKVLEDMIARKLKEVERAMTRLVNTWKVQWSVDEDEESLPSRLADAALQKIQIIVERVHVRYEDAVTDPARPLTLGIVVDSVKCQPCTEACCREVKPALLPDPTAQTVLAQSSPALRHHIITWDGLSMYLNAGLLSDLLIQPPPEVEGGSTRGSGGNWTGLDLDKVQVMLAPNNGRISLTTHDGRVTSSSSPPATALVVQVDRFEFGIQEAQIKLIRQLYSHFIRAKIIARYKSIPKPDPRTPAALWKYAFHCVKQDLSVAETALSSVASTQAKVARWRQFVIAHKWSLFDKRTRVVLPPTYFPAFAICQVQFNHEVTVLQVIEGRSFPASTTTVDWFTFDASLSLLTADPETVAVSRAEATRLWNLASMECTAKELVEIQCEALAEIVTEKQLQLRRDQQADELSKLKKRSGGLFGRLKSEGVGWVAVPYACARAVSTDQALPSTPVPDAGDLKSGSKPLASAEWRSALLSHEAYSGAKNKHIKEVAYVVFRQSDPKLVFREVLKLADEERQMLRGVLRSDNLHPANYVRSALTVHCESIEVSLLTSRRHKVTEIVLEGLHIRNAKRVSKMAEISVRLSQLSVRDGTQPSPLVSGAMWDRLRDIVSFQPQRLELPRDICDSDDLTLTAGYYSWLKSHTGLAWSKYSEVPCAAAILRDEASVMWLLADFEQYASELSSVAVGSAKQVLKPAQFALLGDLVKFWKSAEQFSLLGSAYRSREVVLALYSSFFRELPKPSADKSDGGYIRFSSVRIALTEVNVDALDAVDMRMADILDNDATVPSGLFSEAQASILSLLERGLLFQYLTWRWCHRHGCLATQCGILGRSCSKACATGPLLGVLSSQRAIPTDEDDGHVILVHLRQRSEKPVHKAEADDASDDEAEDDASSFDSASVFSPVGITSRAPSDLVLKDGVLLFPQPDGLAWTNAYCILRSNSNRLEWFSDATMRTLIGRMSLIKLSRIVLGDASLATGQLDDEGVDVFQRRGMSLLHIGVSVRNLNVSPHEPTPSAASGSTPMKSRLWPSFRDRRASGKVAAAEMATSQQDVLLNAIAPSSTEAREWKAALETYMMIRKQRFSAANAGPQSPVNRARNRSTFLHQMVLSKMLVLVEVAPVSIVVNHLNVDRVRRMVQRTASGYRSGSVGESYMDRVKLVVTTRRLGFLHTATGSGSGTSDATAAEPGSPAAGAVGSGASSMFVSVALEGVSISFPLVCDCEPDPTATATVVGLGDENHIVDSGFSSDSAASALVAVFRRTVGQGLISKLKPVGSNPNMVSVVDVVLSKLGIRSLVPDEVPPKSAVASPTEAVTTAQAAWSATCSLYEGYQFGLSSLRVRLYEAVAPSSAANPVTPLITDEREWLHSFGLTWCGQLLSMSGLDVQAWMSSSLDVLRLPRFMVDTALPTVHVMVSPEHVKLLTELSSAWSAVFDRSRPVVAAGAGSTPFPPSSTSALHSHPTLKRSQSMLSHKVAVSVQTRVALVVDKLVLSVLLTRSNVGSEAANASTSNYFEPLRLRLGRIASTVSLSSKSVDLKSTVDTLMCSSSARQGTCTLDGWTDATDHTIEAPFLYSGMNDDPASPVDGAPPQIGSALSVSFRQGSLGPMVSIGNAKASTRVRVGLLKLWVSSVLLNDFKSIQRAYEEVLRPDSNEHAPAAAADEVAGHRSDSPAQFVSEFDPHSTPDDSDTPSSPDKAQHGKDGRAGVDAASREQSFAGWESLFEPVRETGLFSEVVSFLARVRRAFGATETKNALIATASAHTLVECDGIEFAVGSNNEMFVKGVVDKLRCVMAKDLIDGQIDASMSSGDVGKVSGAPQTSYANKQAFYSAAAATVFLLKGIPFVVPMLVDNGTDIVVQLPDLADTLPVGGSAWSGQAGCFTKLELERLLFFVDHDRQGGTLEDQTIACARLKVSAEQSPQDLPEDVLDRDFKSFQVGVTGNTVRQLVLLEAFSVPWSVRILKWNPLFRALKGFQKSILVHLGGVLIEADPLCLQGLNAFVGKVKAVFSESISAPPSATISRSTTPTISLQEHIDIEERSRVPHGRSRRRSEPKFVFPEEGGPEATEGGEPVDADVSQVETTVHADQLILRMFTFANHTWPIPDDKAIPVDVGPPTRHRRQTHGSMDGSLLSAFVLPTDINKPVLGPLPAVVEFCEMELRSVEIEVRDQLDEEPTGEVTERSKHIKIAAVDAFMTDLSPCDPSTSRSGTGVFVADASDPYAYVAAKPNCFLLRPLYPSRVPSGKATRFHKRYSKTAELWAASQRLTQPSKRPSRSNTPDSFHSRAGVRSRPASSEDDDKSDSSDGSVEVRRQRLSIRKTSTGQQQDTSFLMSTETGPKKHSLVVSIVLPEGDGMTDVIRKQLADRFQVYSALQLQAWRDGTSIPMPRQDTGQLDTKYGNRTMVHLSRISFVHSKRFEDELKATIEILRSSMKKTVRPLWMSSFLLREKTNQFDYLKVNGDTVKISLPPTLADGSNHLTIFTKSLKVASSPGFLNGGNSTSNVAGVDTGGPRPIVMEYFAVNCEGVAATFTMAHSSTPTPVLSGLPGQFLKVNFGSPLNTMEKCAARVQMQTDVVIGGGASLSIAESVMDAMQLTLKSNAKECSLLMRLPPVLNSTADMIIKADVPSLHLRVDEVVDLAVPLALRPKKPWVGKTGTAAPAQTQDNFRDAAAASSTASMLRKDSRKSVTGGGTAPPTSKSQQLGVRTDSSDDAAVVPFKSMVPLGSPPAPPTSILGSPLAHELKLSQAVTSGLSGSLFRARQKLPSFRKLDALTEEVSSIPPDPDSRPGSRASAQEHSFRSLDPTVPRAGVLCDLAVPDARLKPHAQALSTMSCTSPNSSGSQLAVDSSFASVLSAVEDALRALSQDFSSTDQRAAARQSSELQRKATTLADAVAAARERAMHISRLNYVEIDLLSRNNSLLVQSLAETQAAEMAATIARLHGGSSKP